MYAPEKLQELLARHTLKRLLHGLELGSLEMEGCATEMWRRQIGEGTTIEALRHCPFHFSSSHCQHHLILHRRRTPTAQTMAPKKKPAKAATPNQSDDASQQPSQETLQIEGDTLAQIVQMQNAKACFHQEQERCHVFSC